MLSRLVKVKKYRALINTHFTRRRRELSFGVSADKIPIFDLEQGYDRALVVTARVEIFGHPAVNRSTVEENSDKSLVAKHFIQLFSLLLVDPVLMSARYFLTLTSLDSKYIQVRKEIYLEGYAAIVPGDLIMVTESYLHMNHLMVMRSADQMQIVVVIVSPKKVARTISLTSRVNISQ